MLIPGIYQYHLGGKMKITSKEWAKLGLPLGIATMLVYFVVLFLPVYLGV